MDRYRLATVWLRHTLGLRLNKVIGLFVASTSGTSLQCHKADRRVTAADPHIT